MAWNRAISRWLVCVCISLSLLAGGASAATEEERRKIVTAVNAISLSLLQPILLAIPGLEIVHTLTLINALAIRLPDLSLAGLEAIVQDLLSNPLVVAVDDDILGTATETSPVTQADVSADASPAPGLWGADRIGVRNVQQLQPKPSGAGVTVAVLDTGIDCQHPELRENIASIKGFSAFAGADPCVDDNSHGTHVSGTIAAAWQTYEFISVAPKAQLLPVKVLNRYAQGFCSDVVAGIQFVSSKGGIKVANMSFGFYRPCNPLEKAIKRLSGKGVIVVASAGNCGSGDEGGDGEGDPPDACDNPSQLDMAYPAAYSQAIAVGAITKDNQLAYYSLYSLEGPTVAVVAPGGDENGPVLSTVPGGGHATKFGTSMAAAHVAGAAVLALQRNPKLSGQDVRSLLRSTASPLVDSTGEEYPSEQQGAGVIDLEAMFKSPLLQ